MSPFHDVLVTKPVTSRIKVGYGKNSALEVWRNGLGSCLCPDRCRTDPGPGPFPSEPQFHCQYLEGVAVKSFPVVPFHEVNY